MRPLDRIQQKLNTFLDDVATIEKEATGTDVYGVPVHDWALVADGVACRLIRGRESRAGAVAMVGEQTRLSESYRVILPVGTEVQAGYRVTVGGVQYRVIGIGRVTGLFLDVVVTT